MAKKEPETKEESQKSKGGGGTPRPGSLTSFDRLRREAARVYRDARVGALSPQDAARLVYVLTMISKLIEAAEHEKESEKDQGTVGRLIEIFEAGRKAAQEDGASDDQAEDPEEDTTQEAEAPEEPLAKRRHYIPAVRRNPLDAWTS